MKDTPVVTMDVHNISLSGAIEISAFPPQSVVTNLSIREAPDYKEAVQRLKDRYLVPLTLAPGFPATREKPRLYHVRHCPVVTSQARASVRTARPDDSDWWQSVEHHLMPVQHLLCFAQRRSINFVHHVCQRRRSPNYDREPAPRASNHSYALLEGAPDTSRFLEGAVPKYWGMLVTASDDQFNTTFIDALLYYLGSFRDDLRITERFFDAFLALELLAEAHGRTIKATKTLPSAEFRLVQSELADCIRHTQATRDATAKEQLQEKLGGLNRIAVKEKIQALLSAHCLPEYECDVGEWKHVRDDLAHRGITDKLAASPDERGTFWERYVERVRACLEKLFLATLLPDGSKTRAWFSDSFERDPETDNRWREAHVWPSD